MPKKEDEYATKDAFLATTLATVGCRFPRDDKGLIRPFLNIYFPQRLREYGFSQGTPIEDAAREAWRKGLRGELTYLFLQDDLFERVIQTWNTTSATMEMEAEGHTATIPIEASPELITQICCRFAGNRKWYNDHWRHVPPMIPEDMRSRLSTRKVDDGKGGMKDQTIVVGSFKVISLGLSAEDRKRLKVK